MKKILIFDRMNSSKFPGGDTVQIHEIQKFLVNNGYRVKVSDQPLEDLRKYDYVFIFNLTNPLEAYVHMKACEKHQKPYILFPVYWNLDSLKMPMYFNIKSLAKNLLPKAMKSLIRSIVFMKQNKEIIRNFNIKPRELLSADACIKRIIAHAYYICPNSNAEWEHLNDNFTLNKLNNKVKVIYNGIDVEKLNNINQDDSIKEKYKLPDNYICCVGGIGPRKNQLNLVNAANQADINLVIIGQASSGCENYYNLVKSTAKSNIYFIDHLPQNEVFKIVKSSKGHIQPSFIETPGLASLEAAMLGVPIIVANTAPVKEYFGDSAIYCEPDKVDSICNSLIMLKGTLVSNDSFQHSVISNYDWNLTLEKLKTLV